MAFRRAEQRIEGRRAATRQGIAAFALGLVLGCKSSDPAPPRELPPSVVDAYLDGNSLQVELADTYGNFLATCDKGSELQKESGEAWTNGVPGCGDGSYYLDGTLVQNAVTAACSCFENVCQPFPSILAFSIGETFLTGSMLVPGSDAGTSTSAAADAGADGSVDGGAITAGGVTADGGAAGGSGARSLPTFETRPYLGPYQVILRYHVDPECMGDLEETPPLALSASP